MNAAADTKPCNRCGKPTTARIPDDLRDTRWEQVLEEVAVLCDDCQAEEDREIAAEEAAEAEAQYERRLGSANMPKRLRRLSWDGVELDDANREAVESAKAWAAGELAGLVLSGPVGVGKTWVAATAANGLLRTRNVMWFSAPRLMAQARAGFNNPAREEVTALLTSRSLALVLDDIDKISPTDYARDIFFELIDERGANGTPLLVTTNLRYPELEERFGEPIASRLKLCKGHRIEGTDRRGR